MNKNVTVEVCRWIFRPIDQRPCDLVSGDQTNLIPTSVPRLRFCGDRWSVCCWIQSPCNWRWRRWH